MIRLRQTIDFRLDLILPHQRSSRLALYRYALFVDNPRGAPGHGGPTGLVRLRGSQRLAHVIISLQRASNGALQRIVGNVHQSFIDGRLGVEQPIAVLSGGKFDLRRFVQFAQRRIRLALGLQAGVSLIPPALGWRRRVLLFFLLRLLILADEVQAGHFAYPDRQFSALCFDLHRLSVGAQEISRYLVAFFESDVDRTLDRSWSGSRRRFRFRPRPLLAEGDRGYT